MLDHFGVPVADVERSLTFYSRAFEPIGMAEAMRIPVADSFVIGLSTGSGHPDFWLSPGTGPAPELHIAFAAPDAAAVDAVHSAAVEAGVEILHAPRVWSKYHPSYYAVFLRDPDGHNVEAVHHGG